MARRKEKEPLEKETILLFKGDMERLQAAYPELGGSKVIRTIVREHLNSIEAKLPEAQLPEVGVPV